MLTTPYEGTEQWDAAQPFEIHRIREPWLLPHPVTVRRINRLADEFGADLIMLDPALPLGAVGPYLNRPYGVVLHGAEVTFPGRIPGSRQLLSRVLRGATAIVAAGGYPAAEAEHAAGRSLPITVVPPDDGSRVGYELVSQAFGAGRLDDCRRWLTQGLWLALACTPVVRYPVDDVKAGAKVKGESVIELGSGNQPRTMIAYEKGGKR